jgi:hypothetical protein
MRIDHISAAVLAFLLFVAGLSNSAAVEQPTDQGTEAPVSEAQKVELGKRMYREGILPSGETMTALIQGDIEISGDQVICGYCHRRSGIGSTEGQDVALTHPYQQTAFRPSATTGLYGRNPEARDPRGDRFSRPVDQTADAPLSCFA